MTTQHTHPIAAGMIALIVALGVVAPAVAAPGSWVLLGVECDDDSDTVTVFGDVHGSAPSTDNIYLNGRLMAVNTVDTAALGNGHASYSIKISQIKTGSKVKVVNDETGMVAETTCRPAVPLNEGHGDHYVTLFRNIDPAGKPSLEFYCIENGQGQYKGRFVRADLGLVPSRPAAHTWIKSIPGCAAPINIYQLTTGETQINIGPDWEGKSAVIVFFRLPPTDVYFYDIP